MEKIFRESPSPRMQTAKNNIKIRSPAINKIVSEDRYDPEDITEAERAYIERHTPKPRVPRTDLKTGDLVVILEGGYMGKKGVFLKQTEGCKAYVSGVRSINGMPLIKIDERYLLKLESRVEVSGISEENFSEAIESVLGEAERVENESSMSPVEEAVLFALGKVKFMKSYFASEFTVDTTTDFYSQKY